MGAQETLQAALDQYGLGNLSGWAWQKYQAGEDINQIMIEIRATPEYKQRFPAMDTLAGKGRAISEDAYIEYERTAVQLAQQYLGHDAATQFMSRGELGNLIGGDVSVAELEQRLAAARTTALGTDQTTRDQLHQMYGVDLNDLTAYFLDQNVAVPILQKRVQAAQVSAQGVRSGFGALSTAEGENLATLGVTGDQAAQGFTQLARQRELFGSLDQGEGTIGRDVQLGAEFGQSAEDQTLIENRQKRRLAAFQGGGQYAAGQSAGGTGYRGV